MISRDDNNQLLRLSRVPADQIPEKTVIRMAAALSKEQKEFMSDTDAVDQMLMMAVNRFNRGSSEYRVELEIVAGATELGTMLASGDIPDLIDWNNYGQYIDDPISMEALAKRGYLVDLEPLIDADSELSTEDFLPGLISAMRERTGGLHTVPTYIYSLYLSARTEYVSGYVGKDGGWTFSDLLAAARTMPEDMTLFDYMTQQDALAYFLSPCLSEFVDVSKGTCDFENQEFYDLLTMCRDYCPAETGEDFVPADSLLHGDGVMGRLGNFASDTLRTDGQNGWTIMPFPNTDGSPMAYVIYDELSICTYGAHQEGAWQLRTLLGYDYQYHSSAMMPTRIDAMNDREDWYLEVNGSCTEEESQTARQMLLDSTALRSRNMTVINMIQEEAAACFAGDKSPEETAKIIQSRVEIYLGEMS